MKDWPVGSYLVMNITLRFPGEIPLLAIGYKYNYRKVLGFISTKGARSIEPGDTYLSRFPDIYSNISILPVVRTHLLGRYFNACNTIDNQNRIRKSDIALDKYWVTQSGYFRLANTLALGMGITDGKLLHFHGLKRGIWKRNNQHWITTTGRFMTASVILLQLILVSQICIYLPSSSMIDPPNIKEPAITQICSKLTSLLPLKILLDSATLQFMNKDLPFKVRLNRGYCCSKHVQIICYKNKRFYCST